MIRMDDVRRITRIYELDEYNYPKFRSKLVDLYLHAFTTGEYAQSIIPQTVDVKLDGMIRGGTGHMAFVDDHVVGLLVAFPLSRDPEFPSYQCSAIPVKRTVYIAEVMVHADYRGKGIASYMLENLQKKASRDYSCAVIRVWEKNKPALELYRKMEFTPIATISQRKRNHDGEEFEMKKIYLSKYL